MHAWGICSQNQNSHNIYSTLRPYNRIGYWNWCLWTTLCLTMFMMPYLPDIRLLSLLLTWVNVKWVQHMVGIFTEYWATQTAPQRSIIIYYWCLRQALHPQKCTLCATDQIILSLAIFHTGADVLYMASWYTVSLPGVFSYTNKHNKIAIFRLEVTEILEMTLCIWMQEKR